MLLPDGCDCHLTFPSSSEPVNCLVSNRDHTIILVVTDASVYFYQAETKLLSCILQRDEEDVNERGPFRRAYWKPDSTAICITTANNFLNIYSVEITPTPSVFNLHDPIGEDKAFTRQSTELFLVKNRVQINVHLTVIARLEAEPKCVLSFKDELLLSLNDGWLHRLNWSGNVLSELSFNIQSISSKEKGSQKQKRSNLHILDIAPFLGGICGVFNDGRAALLVSNSPDFKSDSLTLIWANGMVDACCCSTNFKFRLIYFGCKNGDIAGYSLDEVNGGLIQSFRIHLTLKNGTEYLDRLASVRQISCLSPQGTAFAAIWERKILDEKKLPSNGHQSGISSNFIAQQSKHCPPTLAIFSPFGEQWWCSLEDNYSGEANGELQSNLDACLFTTLDWAIDGFQLWLGTSNGGIQLINTIRSIPNSHDHLMMVGADRIFLCPTDNTDQLAKSAPHLIWQQFKPPNNYIASNWPIKHIAIGHNPERILVVGGSHGFCTYTFKHSKWRMFRKEAQEKSLLLTGGVIVFGEFILCSACNLDAPSDEADRLYVFRAEEQLDLDLAHFSLTNRILEMKLSGSNLITFDVNSMVNIYSIFVQLGGNKNKKAAMELEMECIAEIRIAEFLHHPNCLVSLELAKLNFHSDALPFCGDKDSLLINVSGHLLLLSPMQPQQMNGRGEKNGESEAADDLEFQLHPPTLVASFVEEFWIIHSENGGDENGQIPYLSEAIWINAGCKKSRIWLPLLIEMERKKSMSEQKQKPQLVQQNSRTFISRRIMLPFAMDIYPLFIDNIYLACGATCNSLQLKTAGGKPLMGDDVSLTSKFTEDDSLNDFVGLTRLDEGNPRISMHTIARTSEVFIHKLLRQLLKRNLGSYAFELASSCRPLPYFQHILELLLHDLLDEEATSSEPIPDPLLPTVVSFLREFPAEYLQTIVHCARKTELAFWNLLFSVSNHPRQLFQMCLQEGQLQTATSCLIILHSLISIQESSKLAFQLLEEALSKRRWNVAQDILRFMQNINRATERDSVDFGDQPESPPLQSKLATFPHPPHHHPMNNLPFNSSADEFNFPLFSSQIDIEPSNVSSSVAAAFVQQRRRSGSGKMAATADSSHPKHISAFSRKQQSTAKPNSPPNTGKEKSAAISPPPLAMPSKNDQTHYSGLDEILAKHAANLLENYALRDLGAFCSFLPLDFAHFFKRPENVFSIPAEEFPLVLMKLHAQFSWPYPIGDGGQLPGKNIIERINGSIIMADEAKSANGRQRGDSINSASTSTTGGGALSDLGGGSTSSTSTTLICDWKVLEKISEKVEKQTEQADAELAFIFDQLQRAEAFEWLFLLSILRRDIPLFNEKVLARMREFKDQGRRLELFLARIRDGTRVLHNWAQTICPAYQPVMLVFKQFVECDDG